MKLVFRPKYKALFYNKKFSIMQNSWLNLLPYFVIFGYDDDDDDNRKSRFDKLAAISFGWIYWEFTLQINNW